MQVTLTYFFLNTKRTIKMKFGSNISVLYDKYFQHVQKTQCWRLEINYRHFYDFIKIAM